MLLSTCSYNAGGYLRRVVTTIIAFAVPAIVTVVLRYLLLGRPPFTDDGWYASVAWFAYNGWEPSLHSPIGVYPRLLSSVFAASSEMWQSAGPFFLLRAFDGIAAALTACCVTFSLRCWGCSLSNACVSASLWSICVNHSRFIDAGFKNQLIVATGLLCLAIAASAVNRSRQSQSLAQSMVAGVCLGLACLLREAFLPHATAVIVILFWRGGWKPATFAAFWTAITGFIGLVIIGTGYPHQAGILAGTISGTQAIVTNWIIAAKALSRLDEVMLRNWVTVFYDSGGQAFWAGAWFILFSVVMLCFAGYVFIRSRLSLPAVTPVVIEPSDIAKVDNRRPHVLIIPKGAMLLVSLLALAPLPEIVTKLAFPYHFSMFALPFCFLQAFASSFVTARFEKDKHYLSAKYAVMLSLFISLPLIYLSRREWQSPRADSLRWWTVMVNGSTDASLIADSFYLRLAAAVRTVTAKDATIVSSGFYYSVFPLAKARPFLPEAADLSFVQCLPQSERDNVILLLHNRIKESGLPDVVIESKRIPTDFATYIPGFPSGYRLVEELVPGTYYSYGPYDAKVWVRENR